MSPFDSAMDYVRRHYAAFQHLGRVELPAIRRQATALMIAANDVGDKALAQLAQQEFNEITKAGADWEIQNDRIESFKPWLAKVGVSLGALPVAWVVAGVIASVAVMTGLFGTRDRVGRRLVELAKQLPPDVAAKVLLDYEREKTKQDQDDDWAGTFKVVAIAAALIVVAPKVLDRWRR